MNKAAVVISPLMSEVSAYIAGAPRRRLPADVAEKGKHHVLDALAAMLSGSALLPGKKALAYIARLGGARQACVAGTRLMTSAANAALANGVFAHADESDDSHHGANLHPGASIVPAALAMAERERRDGRAMLRSVVMGYDIGCRITRALQPEAFKAAGHTNQCFGGVFGAAAAAGALAGLDARGVRYVLSYASQLASGIRTFERDGEHMLKAFIFGGMTAHNGVAAAAMVASGFTGVEDEFTGARNRNFFSAYSPDPKPEEMLRGLGTTYEIMATNIKKWPVGSPMQAALVSLLTLMHEHKIGAADVDKLVIHTPDNEAFMVDDNPMSNINMQYLLAVTLLDGALSFEAAHHLARMNNRKVVELKRRMQLIASAELTAARPPRQCTVEITTRDGRQLRHHTYAVKGTADNPMTRAEVEEKAADLMGPVLGKKRTQQVIDTIWNIEQLGDVRKLGALLKAK
jgi:2-methylcitrate dehydratase PrpD